MSVNERIVISIFDDEDNPHYSGGGPVMVRLIAQELLEDFEVILFTAGRRWRRTERDGIIVIHLPVLWAGPRGAQILWGLFLPFVALACRHDLWIESFTPPVSSNLLPLVSRRPVIGLAQALSGREMAERYGSGIFLRIEQRLLLLYADIVVLNSFDADVIRQCSPSTRVHLIPNAVKVSREPVRDNGAGVQALFLGRIAVQQKGLDLLLRAYQVVRPESMPLVIAGSGLPEEENQLRDLLEGRSNLRWVGHVSGPAKDDALDQAAFVIVSSREESFSLAALEAMSRGRPVIHFDLPQLNWIPTDCGIKVPRFDTSILAAAIDKLSQDVALRRAMGCRAREFALEAYEGWRGGYQRLLHDVLHAADVASVPAPQEGGKAPCKRT